jgi:hypothetical protein
MLWRANFGKKLPTVRYSLLLVPLSILGLAGCDEDMLGREPPKPDAMIIEYPDAELTYPDAEVVVVDGGVPDVGVPDAGEDIPVADDPVYINTGPELFTYAPGTGSATRIGRFLDNRGEALSMVDIAIDLSGRMFGGSNDKRIYRVDPNTAACTLLATYDDILHGMTFLSDGRLVVAGERVTTVDPQTGRTLDELVPEGEFVTSGDIIGLPDGKLYWSVRGEAREDPDLMVRIDPRTRRTEVLGSTNVQGIFGLGYADDVLYGFLRGGERVDLDQDDGHAIRTVRLSGEWYGATTNPVLW